jgi:hypothetical protein
MRDDRGFRARTQQLRPIVHSIDICALRYQCGNDAQ